MTGALRLSTVVALSHGWIRFEAPIAVGNIYHLFRAVESVQRRLDPDFHVVGNSREILPGLGQLGIAFPQGRAPPASVKKVIGKFSSECPKVSSEKWNVVLIGVSRKCRNIRQVVCFRQPNTSGSFFYFRACRDDFGVRRQRYFDDSSL